MKPNTVTTINLTPTWSSILPGLIAMLQNGTHESIQYASEELTRMAKLADQQVSIKKNNQAGLFINEKIKKFIKDKKLVNIQQSPTSELYDLWKDQDGCVWDYEKIKNGFETN